MKRSLFTVGLVLLSAGMGRADWVLVQKVEGAGQSGEATIKVKDGKIRADITPAMSAITDCASGEVTMLMHSQKAYLTLGAVAMKQLLERTKQQAQQLQAGEQEPKLEATGKHESINGQDTEIFTTQSGTLKARYWIAKGYPEGARLLEVLKAVKGTPLSAMARQMAPQPTDFPGVPVKTELELTPKQKITNTLVSVKEEPVSAADFAVPAGYTALPSPEFGGK